MEGGPAMLLQNRLDGSGAQAFDIAHRHADGSLVDRELRARLIDPRRQQRQAEPMALQHINQRIIKALPIREHRGHELGRKIVFQPGGLISFHSVSGAMRFAERITGKASD